MAYPQGGGSYTVANENLGVWPGLLAAASLMVDYVLTAAVGISTGVGHARRALTIIIGILMVMLAGIAILVRAYGIAATPPGAYDSVLSQLLGAVAGKGAFYWISIGSILVVLSLSGAFADFPRLARAIAQNGFLPHPLALSHDNGNARSRAGR